MKTNTCIPLKGMVLDSRNCEAVCAAIMVSDQYANDIRTFLSLPENGYFNIKLKRNLSQITQ